MRRPGEFPQHVRDALADRDDPCAVCGRRFVPGDVIQIDHIYALEEALKDPYFREDPNGIDNAVRLHKACHELKTFATRGARKWQSRAWLTFMNIAASGDRRFAMEVAMGAGKSYFYIAAFLGWRQTRPQAKLVVVVPSTQIMLGICQTAYRRGLSVRAYASASPGQMVITDAQGREQFVEVSKSYDPPPSFVDVCVVNFQGLSERRIHEWAHSLFRAYPVMFVGDEWHHSSTNVNHDWGRAAARLLYRDWDGEDGELLPQMLVLGTGTPHRTDRERLPGWPYRQRYEELLDEHGEVSTQLIGHEIDPHFSYTLREAVEDGVDLPLLLSVYSAERGWTKVKGDHVTEGSSPLSESSYKDAIRDPATWEQLIPQAVLAMRQRQRFHPKAQLLIIAPARRQGDPRSNPDRIVEWITASGLASAVAITSETEAGQRAIDRLRKGSHEVGVMIRMGNEGMDLPDVVGVLYLGDDRTVLALDQAAGRPNRRTPEMHPDLSAFFMGLDIPPIANWANEMYLRQPPLYQFERALENQCLCGEQCSCPNCPCQPGCACRLEGGSCFVPLPEQPETPTDPEGTTTNGPSGPVDPPEDPPEWPDDPERPEAPAEPPTITIDHSWVEQLVAKQIAEGLGDIRPVEEMAFMVAERMSIAQPDAQILVETFYERMGFFGDPQPPSPPPPPPPPVHEPLSEQRICKQLRLDLGRVVGNISYILRPKGTISERERSALIGRINNDIWQRARVRDIDRENMERPELERLMVEANSDLADARRGRSRYS